MYSMSENVHDTPSLQPQEAQHTAQDNHFIVMSADPEGDIAGHSCYCLGKYKANVLDLAAHRKV